MQSTSGTTTTLYGGAAHRRITILDLKKAKAAGEKWAMLTSYEQMTAEIFDAAGIPVLLVGDSAGNNFLGHENTIPVTVDDLLPLTRAVVNGSKRAMVVADLPFGSYESSPEQALATSTRFFKEAGAMAVKLEGAHLATVEKLISAGIPVMGHLGLTPQSLHQQRVNASREAMCIDQRCSKPSMPGTKKQLLADSTSACRRKMSETI